MNLFFNPLGVQKKKMLRPGTTSNLMLSTRPKFGFARYSDSELADKATQIHAMMSVNPLFPTPPVTYVALLALIQGFNSAIANALNRDKVKVAQRREVREDLEQALKTLAAYIMTITANELEIEETGFDVVERSGPVGVPAAPQNVRTSSAGAGKVQVEWKRSHGALSYIVEYTTGDPELPGTVWLQAGTPTQTKFTVEGLNPLTYYWFRVRANGTAGVSEPSAPGVGLSI